MKALRDSIHKSGPADLAQKTDFAYFLYTERLSCRNAKNTIRLIKLQLLSLSSYERFSDHPREHSWWPIRRLKFKVTLEVNFKKNVRSFIKQTSWTESFWATRATFIKVKRKRRPYWQFSEPNIVRFDHARENRSNTNFISIKVQRTTAIKLVHLGRRQPI